MTIFEMLGQSGVLTLLGMGIVFGFLVILVITVTLIGKIFRALGLDKEAGAPVQAVKPAAKPANSQNNAAVTAAISAAVNEYRKSN